MLSGVASLPVRKAGQRCANGYLNQKGVPVRGPRVRLSSAETFGGPLPCVVPMNVAAWAPGIHLWLSLLLLLLVSSPAFSASSSPAAPLLGDCLFRLFVPRGRVSSAPSLFRGYSRDPPLNGIWFSSNDVSVRVHNVVMCDNTHTHTHTRHNKFTCLLAIHAHADRHACPSEPHARPRRRARRTCSKLSSSHRD